MDSVQVGVSAFKIKKENKTMAEEKKSTEEAVAAQNEEKAQAEEANAPASEEKAVEHALPVETRQSGIGIGFTHDFENKGEVRASGVTPSEENK